MGLSTHILDTAQGRPAAGVAIVLSHLGLEGNHEWQEVGRNVTDNDGRCRTLLGEASLHAGLYKLHFSVASYFAAQRLDGLYPWVEITFVVRDPSQHYHIPLLLTANGYTTYRGS
jgi:5-hydroxyisourate hydrolase